MTRPVHLPLAAALALLVAACSPVASPSAAGPTASPPAGSGATGGIPEACPDEQPAPLPAGETRTVTFTTDKGDIVIAIDGSLAPIAAGNFVALAECGYYTGTIFHRIIPGFVIQGGDGEFGRQPTPDFDQVGTGGPGYTIADEPVTTPFVRGTFAMARTPAPNSQGSQFFIVLDDENAAGLADAQPGYAIMGAVTSGMEIADEISLGPNGGTQTGNLALSPATITGVTVTTP